MAEHATFRYHNLQELHDAITELGVDVPTNDDLSILGEQISLNVGLSAPNRFSVQPMEGFDADTQGRPGSLSHRRYRRYAHGGSGLIWFEATAVVREGRSNPAQFYINSDSQSAFTELVSQTRQAAREAHGREPVLILQLTHSGRYSKPNGAPEPIIAHRSPVLDPVQNLPEDYPVVTDEYLDGLQDQFVQAAEMAAQAGFDGVDIKSCHRYLVSELHASFTREGKYGGDFENRTRFIRETAEKIRRKCPELLITTRMNVYDAISYPYGFGVDQYDYRVPDLTEPLELIRLLKEITGMPLLNISAGNPYYNPHFGRPFDQPIAGGYIPEEHPLEGVARLQKLTATVQNTHTDLAVVGTGYAWLRHLMPYAAAGNISRGDMTFAGQGRGAFAYPDSVSDILEKGEMDLDKCCITCSACTQIMRDGGRTGCVVRDSEVYGPEYRLARKYSFQRLQEEAKRCRDCFNATCTRACPAHVDVPRFVKAFADGDIESAYAVLKHNNVLPEMCGFVCPAAEQCQGGCLDDIFCRNPVSIQDIQLVTARTARLKGLIGVDLPAADSGRHAAVIGGGPAGLACAIRLLEQGHFVTIYEAGDTLGGTPESMIPDERYGSSRAEVDGILQPAFEAGRLAVEYGSALGQNLDIDTLSEQYDAVFLGAGLQAAARLEHEAEGVMDALDFLKRAKQGTLDSVPSEVAVIGGGNTAADAAITARDLGAEDVYLIYRRSFQEMPLWEQEREQVLKRGIHTLVLSQPAGYETDADGHLTGVRVARTRLGAPDASGRRRPELLPDTENLLPVSMVIEALGQKMPEKLQEALSNIELTAKGLIKTGGDGSLQTSHEKVYAGGDAVNGGGTAVEAIRDGMNAAEEIDHRLQSA